MAMKRFPCEKYASLELNQVSFSKTGMVVSQTPLDKTAFPESAPCENGMWVVADKSTGTLKPCTAVGDKPFGIVYTTEKEYDDYNIGLKNFAHRVGAYPRVGIFSLGDTVTTNCLQYNDTTYATEAALFAALEAYATTPVYVAPVAGSAVPQLTASKPASGTYGKVTKFYTMPNGERGVKYEIVNL